MKGHELVKRRETARDGRFLRENEKEGKVGGGEGIIDTEHGRGMVESGREEGRAGGKVLGGGGRETSREGRVEVGEVEDGAVLGGDRWVHQRHRGGKMVM